MAGVIFYVAICVLGFALVQRRLDCEEPAECAALGRRRQSNRQREQRYHGHRMTTSSCNKVSLVASLGGETGKLVSKKGHTHVRR